MIVLVPSIELVIQLENILKSMMYHLPIEIYNDEYKVFDKLNILVKTI